MSDDAHPEAEPSAPNAEGGSRWAADPLVDRLNRLDRAGFVAVVGPLYEHSPWIADRAWGERPFATRAALHDALQTVIRRATDDERLALLRSHPDLAGRLARAEGLEEHSRGEQRGLGLDRLSAAEYAQFDELNRAYRSRFDIPFIVAVRAIGSRTALIERFTARLRNDRDTELRTALAEVATIGQLRLADLS